MLNKFTVRRKEVNMLDERQTKALTDELANIVHMRNALQGDYEKAEHAYDRARKNNASIDELKALDERMSLEWDGYERYDDKLHANVQLLRRVFGIDVQWKENAYGYISEIIIDITPHIGDRVTVEIPLQGWIRRMLDKEQERVYKKYFEV